MNISSRQTAELEVALKEASERFDSQCLLHRQLQVAHDDLVAVNESLKQHRATLEEELDKAKLENEDFRATLDVSAVLMCLPLVSLVFCSMGRWVVSISLKIWVQSLSLT